MFELWFLFAIIAVFMYGTSQAIVKVALGDISVATMIVINFIITMPIYATLLVASLLSSDLSQYGLWILAIGFIAAFLGRAGYYSYLEALESGPVTIVGSITAAYPAIITILALTVLNESITVIQGIGILIVILGIILLSFSSGLRGTSKKFSEKAIFYCVITLAVWGAWGLFAKMALEVLPIGVYIGLYAFALPIVLSMYMTGKRIRVRDAFPKWTLPVIIAAVAVLIGQIGLFADTTAVSLGNASIVFPLIAAYPVITIIEAQIFLKESLGRKEIALVLMIIIGILLVSTI